MKTTESVNEARERVLDVAEKLFMTKGFQAVSMRDIADALGVRQSSLYYHAPQGKEQLFYDAAVRSLERHNLELEGILARYEPDFRRQIYKVAQWFVQLEDMDLVRLVRLDLPEISAQYKHMIAEAFHRTLMLPICSIVERHQAAGNVRDMDPNALVGSLLAISAWTNYFDSTDDGPASPRQPIDQIVDILLDGCWNVRPEAASVPQTQS